MYVCLIILTICFYLTGMAGKTELEATKIDMVADCCEDIVKPLIDIFMEKSETAKVSL